MEDSPICGIVGVVGTINKPAVDVFKFMLLVDQVRGKHSTGMLLADGKEHVTIKKAVNSTDFLDLGVVTKALSDATNMNAIIGHNRYATVGSVNSTNAHPFTHGSITGVHNGTLRNKYSLPDAKDYTVDSDNLYHAFNKQGVEETIKTVGGAFALAWHNNADNTFNLLRNTERPMKYALSKDGKTFFYASEQWMIMVGAHRNKVEIGQVQDLQVGQMLTINLDGYVKNRDLIGPRISTKRVEFKPEVKKYTKVTGKKLKVVFDSSIPSKGRGYMQYYGEAEDGTNICCTQYQMGKKIELGTWYEAETQSTTYMGGVKTVNVYAYNIKEIPNPFKNNVTELKSYERIDDTTGEILSDDDDEALEPMVWFGETVTKLEFTALVANGCAWCSESNLDDDEIHPISKTEFVCAGCKALPEVNQYIAGAL